MALSFCFRDPSTSASMRVSSSASPRAARCAAALHEGAVCHRGGGKKSVQGDLYIEGIADARQHLRSQEGMAAQFEEVVVHAHRCNVQHLSPDVRQLLLHGRAGARKSAGASDRAARCRQRSAVDFPTGHEWQCVKRYKRRRQYVPGQPVLQKAS